MKFVRLYGGYGMRKRMPEDDIAASLRQMLGSMTTLASDASHDGGKCHGGAFRSTRRSDSDSCRCGFLGRRRDDWTCHLFGVEVHPRAAGDRVTGEENRFPKTRPDRGDPQPRSGRSRRCIAAVVDRTRALRCPLPPSAMLTGIEGRDAMPLV